MMASVPLLLFLSEHGTRHGWCRLKWLADLPQLLEGREWDWPAVLAKAREANALGSLLTALALAERLFGWAVPHELRTFMRSGRLLEWRLSAVHRLLEGPEAWFAGSTSLPIVMKLRQVGVRVSCAGSLAAFWGELRFNLLSPHDVRLIALPDALFFLYPLMRPALIAKRRLNALCSRHKSRDFSP
jgi:hypothetical protein